MKSRLYLSILSVGILAGSFFCKPSLDEDRLSQKMYEEALSVASTSGQKVLLVFGADWCGDCRHLKERFEENPQIANLLKEYYLIVHIDVGRFDKNERFSETFGSPQKKGIPALVIIDPLEGGKILGLTNGGEFSRASSMQESEIYSYLKQYVGKQ